MKKDKEKEAVERFVFAVSNEGLAYAIQNYPPDKDAPADLIMAVDMARVTLANVEERLECYMNKYDLEYD